MTGTNDFLVWDSSNTNKEAQATYAADAARTNGVTTGTASSSLANKAWAQSSIMAAMIGQFITGVSGQNAVDDGTTATLLNDFELSVALSGAGDYAQDTGAVNAAVVTLSPAPLTQSSLIGVPIRIKFIANNTGATTLNINGLGVQPITHGDRTGMVTGELKTTSIYTVIWNGTEYTLQTSTVTLAGLQSQLTNYAVDSGLTNAAVITLSPPPASQAALVGVLLRVKFANDNTGATTLNVNGFSPQPVKNADQTALVGGEIKGTSTYAVIWDGAQYILQTSTLSLTNFSALYATGGYQKLPGGLIIQWGESSIPTGNGDVVTLPLAFPNNIFGAIASDFGSGAKSTGWAKNGASLSTILAYGRDVVGGGAYSATAFGYVVIGN